jgi:hypothetical protein
MVFGLSSSKSRQSGLTSDHLPSARNISQAGKHESRKARAMEARVETFHDFLISYFKTAMER